MAERMKREAGLVAIEPEPLGKSVIEVLQDTIGEARKGEISSVVVSVVYRDGTAGWFWSDLPNRISALGAVTRTQWALAQQIEEG